MSAKRGVRRHNGSNVANALAGVIDACTLAGILFGEPEAAGFDLDFRPDQLVSTTLLQHEFANICVKKHQRLGLSAETVLDKFRQYESLGVRVESVSGPEVVAVAIRYGLPSYDAGYLWLAMVKNLPLLTLDRRLGVAYSKALKESS